jgi:phospholipid/cholesterol/gamma-HCH transport system substrate-binding protein
METRARYILMGLFVLLITVGGFGFVYWLHNTSSIGEKAVYRVIFQGSVSGLRTGSAVSFNGVRVGEITENQVRSKAAEPSLCGHFRGAQDAS